MDMAIIRIKYKAVFYHLIRGGPREIVFLILSNESRPGHIASKNQVIPRLR
jgi:hypothetical protein